MATVAECAEHIFLGERRFHEFLDRKIIERKPANGYDLDEVRKQYVVHLRGVAAGRSEAEGGIDLAEARRRKLAAEAEIAEIERDFQKGRIVLVSDVAAIVGNELSVVRSRVLAIASNVAPQLAGAARQPQEVFDLVHAEVSEALSDLSDGERTGRKAAKGSRRR